MDVCDRTIAVGDEYFAGVYETIFNTIVKSEDVTVYVEPMVQLQALAASEEARQRTGEALEAYARGEGGRDLLVQRPQQ